jgi:DNA-binding NarL/FixJ family response regulator
MGLAEYDREVRLLIVDDHAEFRDSASVLLEGEGFDVVGSAATGEEAVGQAMRLDPDLVLLDIQLPGMDGFVTAERLAALVNPPVVVLISSRARSSYGTRIDHAPVRGFLAKHELSGESLKSLIA